MDVTVTQPVTLVFVILSLYWLLPGWVLGFVSVLFVMEQLTESNGVYIVACKAHSLLYVTCRGLIFHFDLPPPFEVNIFIIMHFGIEYSDPY